MAEERQKQDADFIPSRALIGELRRYMPVATICNRTGAARTTLYMIQTAGGELKADQYIRALRLYEQARAAEEKAKELREAVTELYGGSV